MIHSNSTDPVLIKRIGLKIWSLRDEVEAVLNKALQAQPDKKELTPEEVQEIKSEYHYRGPVDQRPNLQLVQGGASEGDDQGDDLEAAMAAAMGGGDEASESADSPEASAEGDDAASEGEESGDDLEAEMAAAMGGGSDEASEAPGTPGAAPTHGPMKVIQRSSDTIAQEKISRGVTILSEVSIDNLYFFGSEKYLEGQSIVIEFQVPKRFVVNATVAYCRPFNIRSRIISDKKVSYRVVARFTFLKDGERTLLRDFIKSIEPDVPEAPTKPVKAEAEESDDDFEGLDGLDL